MIDHLSIGCTDYEKSRLFYDAVMATIGCQRLHTYPGEAAGYGAENKAIFWFAKPLDERKPVVACNGSHIGFAAPSQAAVQAFYAAALQHGGTDDGPPGLRPQYGFGYYAAFMRDPDGHKIEIVFNPQDVS